MIFRSNSLVLEGSVSPRAVIALITIIFFKFLIDVFTFTSGINSCMIRLVIDDDDPELLFEVVLGWILCHPTDAGEQRRSF